MMWLLLGCAAPLGERDGPSMAAAVAPLLAHLDVDHDGRVTEPEYTRVAFSAPTFATADEDGDGALGVAELRTLMNAQDPMRFAPEVAAGGGTVHKGDTRRPGGGPPPGPAPADGKEAKKRPSPDGGRRVQQVRETADVLRFLAAEVQARDPNIPVPTEDEIARASRTADLGSPVAQAVLAKLQAGWMQAGLTFPTQLLAPPTPPTP